MRGLLRTVAETWGVASWHADYWALNDPLQSFANHS